MTLQDRFQRLSPKSIYLDFHHQDKLIALLRRNKWIGPADDILAVEKPGDGNMNFVVRVKTSSTSIVVKQSRPWVEKYPQIAAPVERIMVEAAFYQALLHEPFYSRFCPTVIGLDAENYLLGLEDLGDASDCTFVYQRESTFDEPVLEGLARFISHLHNLPADRKNTFPANAALKELNHTHIFYYPYLEDNGFDLDTIQPGLKAVALRYKNDDDLKGHLRMLGDVYLKPGNTLIHGDYYPGSWLNTNTGVKIIDPEFSHLGNAEFDLAVMIAHLKMARLDAAVRKVWDYYTIPAEFSIPLLVSFCGAEILRRIIGLAQLPLTLTLDEKARLLALAVQWIKHPEEQQLF